VNPFQRARDEAQDLRRTILKERAGEPVPAKDILALIEARLDLGIEQLPQGSPELGGGDACLRRAEKYIYVLKELPDEKLAELVAHELGHWCLDVQKTPITVASLKSFDGMEGTAAVIKVEAYGARERQELLANVFGRELLLPRSIARTLFNSGVKPSDIANDLGLPEALVQQQTLDAILLPDGGVSVPKVLHQPTADQEAAAHAKERFVNVVAGPGTGKTSTLIHRIKYLIEQQNVDPSHILVLTFTNKAAFELVERLRSAGIERAADIWAGTFHAFGLEFLRKFHHCFGLGNDLVVSDKLYEMTLLIKELPNLKLKHFLRVQDPYDWLDGVLRGIKRLKEELVSPTQYRQRLGEIECKDEELRNKREDVATLYEAHERVLRREGLVDFVDLVAMPALAIRDDRARYSELADKFQYVLVDEYQDVTEAMIAFVKQLAQKAKSFWVVGDVRQAIHHWRGASVKSLIVFEQTFKEQADSTQSKIQKYPLKLNRRSSQEIVDLVTKVGELHVLQEHLPLDETIASAGKCNHTPIFMSCVPASAIPTAIASSIKTLHGEGISFGQQAVLCRRKSDLENVAVQLQAQGIPILYIGELAQRAEVKQILCLMQLLTERHPRSLFGLMHHPDFLMPLADIHKMLEWSETDLAWQRGRWLNKLPPGLSKEGQKTVQNLANLLRGQTRSTMPWYFVCNLLLEQRFGLPNANDISNDSHLSRLVLWQFANSVRTSDGDGKRPSLSRYLIRQQLRQRIGESYGDHELPPEAAALDAVHVQTVHGSKGLEYEAVHVGYLDKSSYGAEDSNWTPDDDVLDIVPPEVLGNTVAYYKFEQAVERNNLFYVALSRAKRRLLMYENGDWVSNRPEQLSHSPLTFSFSTFRPSMIPSPSAMAASSQIKQKGSLTFEEFETYARCPLQYQYRYVMGLKREQEADISLRARFAIMWALREISRSPAMDNMAAFLAAWASNQLPSEEEDPELWRDAITAYRRGVGMLKESHGIYEEVQTSIAEMAVSFPWMMKCSNGSQATYEFIRFSPQGAKNVATLMRPMLSGLSAVHPKNIIVSSILSAGVETATPSGKLTSTNAYKAAKRFLSGDHSPVKGHHCKRCAYMTICPSSPS
jgi:superfamily I DNA/RNA helicase